MNKVSMAAFYNTMIFKIIVLWHPNDRFILNTCNYGVKVQLTNRLPC